MALNIDLSKTQAYLEWFKQLLYYNWKANNSKNKNIRVVKRGQVYYCDLGLGIGSEETKNRPCVIIQNNTGNNFSPNTIVAPITNEKAEEKVSVAITGTYTYNDIEDGIKVPFHDSYALGVNVPCQETFGRDCEYCGNEDLRTRDLYAWSVYDYENNEVKIILLSRS